MKTTAPLLPLSVLLLALTGCVSSKYKPAGHDLRSPVALNLTPAPLPNDTGSSASIEVTVHSVIAFHGPGSWKREAYWDEYILTIASRGATTLTVDAATLTDFQGTATSPGTDPWELERQSHSYKSRGVVASGRMLDIGGGAPATPDGALVKIREAAGAYYGVAAVGMAVTATPIGLPVYAIATIFANSTNKQRIAEEFDRRCLKLPLTLTPAQTVQGSLFFRISPGPQCLVLHGRIGSEPHEVVIDLKPLAGLHLKPAPAANNPLP